MDDNVVGVEAFDADAIADGPIDADAAARHENRVSVLARDLAVWEDAASKVPDVLERARARVAAVEEQCAGVIASRDAAKAALEAAVAEGPVQA